MSESFPDESVEQLATLFAEHPAWVDAARRLSSRATSSVYFTHRPYEAWRLDQRSGQTRLLRGAAESPDFVFRFSPASIERLAGVEGGVGEFAVELFTLMTEPPESDSFVGLRIAAPFSGLIRRGYVGLLVAAGPRVMAFGASHGIYTVGALRRFVAQLRASEPQEWERDQAE